MASKKTTGRSADLDAAPETLESLRAALADLREHSRENDPFANPILLLAMRLARRLEQKTLSRDTLGEMIQHLTAGGFEARAARLADRLGERSPEANDAAIRALIRKSAGADGDGIPTVPFAEFSAGLNSEKFGIVFTAHPTFNISADLMRDLAWLAAGRDHFGRPNPDHVPVGIRERAGAAEHKPDADMSLTREHELSLEAVERLHNALYRAWRLVLQETAALYPDTWRELSPRLVTVATWVGYDLDGRSDIRWSHSFYKRLILVRLQLARYLDQARDLARDCGPLNQTLADQLALLEGPLALALKDVEDEIAVFSDDACLEGDGVERLRATAARMEKGYDHRLTSADRLVKIVDRAMETAKSLNLGEDGAPSELELDLAVLRTQMQVFGLGLAHTHVRINATQVHNAIRKEIGLTGDPNDPRFRQTYLNRLNALIEDAANNPKSINFGSVLAEGTSARRLFMVVRQMLKYADAGDPIRFLIAETESAFTVLVALYFAKLFGIDEQIDISPLFETERALEAGSRVVEQLLDNPYYRDYVRRRGRLCVQTGYSDAGRYLGQTPAAASIERLRMRLIRVLENRPPEEGLGDIQLLIFDTHGDSIGRGTHPVSYTERFRQIDTAHTRSQLKEVGRAFKQEMSFQGGDGFLPFMHPVTTYALVTRVLEHVIEPMETTEPDPFYLESGFVREMLTAVKAFQDSLVHDTRYGVLLSAYGTNLLFRSGSRAIKRQNEGGIDVDNVRADQFRAIPHNAILQQMGLLANSIGGVGQAMSDHPEKYRELYRKSPRLRQLMGIAEYGCSVSDPQVMKAYIDVLDPGFWIIRAGVTENGEASNMRVLARTLDQMGLYPRMSSVVRNLHNDALKQREQLANLKANGIDPVGLSLLGDEGRTMLDLAHALRLACLLELFLLATRIPEFSSRHNITREGLIQQIIHLDVENVVTQLEEIFPERTETAVADGFGEAATYQPEDLQSYHEENVEIFEPLRDYGAMVKKLSTAVTHWIGFFG